MRATPGLLARPADQLLELGEVRRQQRLARARRGRCRLPASPLSSICADLLEQLLEVDALLAERCRVACVEGVRAGCRRSRTRTGRRAGRRSAMSSPRFTMRRAQRVLEDLAILERQLVERQEGVDRLRDRDAHPALAQQVRELDDLALHALLRRGRRSPASGARPSCAGGARRAAALRLGRRRVAFVDQRDELLLRLPDVALVLEDHVQRVASRAPRRATTRSARAARAPSRASR